jgi:hypothetical protein
VPHPRRVPVSEPAQALTSGNDAGVYEIPSGAGTWLVHIVTPPRHPHIGQQWQSFVAQLSKRIIIHEINSAIVIAGCLQPYRLDIGRSENYGPEVKVNTVWCGGTAYSFITMICMLARSFRIRNEGR